MYRPANYELRIIPEEEFPKAIVKIEKELDKYRNSGFFDTLDGKKIFYEYFLCENSKASIVIVHGLSEFTKKFYEITYYLLDQGYNVFLYDQRCHGFSSRLTDRMDLIHVDSFSDYVSDLSVYIDKIVAPAEDKPIYIYSHSMGGAVTAMYLARYSQKIKKAVLSAPLFDPQIGRVSPKVARIGVKMSAVLLGKKRKFQLTSEFNPDIPYKKNLDASRNRFNHNMDMRRSDEHYQSTPMTTGWVYNSLNLRSNILRDKVAGRIKTPILLLSPEKDSVVKVDAQHIFAKKCKSCKLVTIKNANHSMLTGSQKTITEHITNVLMFYRD